MNRLRARCLAVLAAIAAATIAAVSPAADSPPVPAGVAHHPAPEAELDALRRTADRAGQRRHAWALFERLIATGDGLPPDAFAGWHTEDETFATPAAVAAAGDTVSTAGPRRAGLQPRFVASRPVAGIAPVAGGADPADAPVLAYTLYNGAAWHHIRTLRLFDAGELERLRTGGPGVRSARNPTIPPFPADSVVIKTAWWPVAGDRPTALPVWDPASNAPRRGGNPHTGWARVVAVDPAVRARDGVIPVEFAGRRFADARRVPIADIPNVVLDARAAAALRREPAARKAVLLALGRDVRAGDFLALVAVHVATREVADWIWATAWWHDAPDDGPHAAGRPEALRGPWRRYLLDVAFDETSPAESDGTPHVAFNPWLEARFPDGGHGGGTASNCLACHRRASWPGTNFLPVTRGAADAARDPAFAPGRLSTQFLWSIALRAHSDAGLARGGR